MPGHMNVKKKKVTGRVSSIYINFRLQSLVACVYTSAFLLLNKIVSIQSTAFTTTEFSDTFSS
jgi:hypothetical protein